MFRFKNLKVKSNEIFSVNTYCNTNQIINLCKHQIYPKYHNNYIMRKELTHMYIHTGKVLLQMHDYTHKLNSTLFCEKNCLFQSLPNEHDLILTENDYVVTILPGIYYNLYAYDNTYLQFFFKSNGKTQQYKITNKKCQLIKNIYH